MDALIEAVARGEFRSIDPRIKMAGGDQDHIASMAYLQAME